MNGVRGCVEGQPPPLPPSGDNTTFVHQNETTLREVADRLSIPYRELLEANPQIRNPNRLDAGSEISIPDRREHAATSSGDRFEPPPIPTIGDYRIMPRPVLETSNLYDGTVEGNQARQRAEQRNLEDLVERQRLRPHPGEVERETAERFEAAGREVDEAIQQGADRARGLTPEQILVNREAQRLRELLQQQQTQQTQQPENLQGQQTSQAEPTEE